MFNYLAKKNEQPELLIKSLAAFIIQGRNQLLVYRGLLFLEGLR